MTLPISIISLGVTALLTLSSCRTADENTTDTKDVEETSQGLEMTPIAFVNYEVLRLHRDLLDSVPPEELARLIEESREPNIRNQLKHVLDEKKNCLQLSQSGSAYFIEFYPKACPTSGFHTDTVLRSFFLVVDVDELREGTFLLRREGIVIGKMIAAPSEDTSLSFSLDDMFCYESDESIGQPCDVIVRDGRWRDLLMKEGFVWTNPDYQGFIGWDDTGSRKDCNRVRGLVSSAGTVFQQNCRNLGLKTMMCRTGETQSEFLCEANIL